MKAYKETIEKTAGLAPKIDLSLSMIRVAFFHADHHEARRLINSTKQLIDQGGDWDRRNRLKVYHGTHLVSAERDFKAGAALLLDALATFTASEVMPYNDFIGLCILAGTLACDRKDLKKRIIDTPEVKTAIADLPHLNDFADSLHQSRYATFFQKLAEVEQFHLYPNHLLAPHARFYVSELRIKAYSQYLESYRSVSLRSLSDAFGLSPEWLDACVHTPHHYCNTLADCCSYGVQRLGTIHCRRPAQLQNRQSQRRHRDCPSGRKERQVRTSAAQQRCSAQQHPATLKSGGLAQDESEMYMQRNIIIV